MFRRLRYYALKKQIERSFRLGHMVRTLIAEEEGLGVDLDDIQARMNPWEQEMGWEIVYCSIGLQSPSRAHSLPDIITVFVGVNKQVVYDAFCLYKRTMERSTYQSNVKSRILDVMEHQRVALRDAIIADGFQLIED